MQDEPGDRFIPLYEELALDSRDRLLDLFEELSAGRKHAGAFYLRRAAPGGDVHQPGETLIAFDPFETIRIRRGRARIDGRFQKTGAPLEIEGDPFSIVSKRVQEYRATGYPQLPFFQGGALGYFAYDSVRFLEPALVRVPGNLRDLDEGDATRPGYYDAQVMLFGKVIAADHVNNRLYLISGYLPAIEGEEAGRKRALAEIEELRKAVEAHRSSAAKARAKSDEGASPQPLDIEKMSSMLGRSRYLDGVRKFKGHIRAGDIFQAVLSDKFTLPFAGEPLSLFRDLTRISPAPYQFYFDSGEGTFMGASPEMLLKVRGRELETHPIAGTRPRGADAAEERKLETQLLRSEKEKAEHLMLVDLARNDVGRVSDPGTVRVEDYMKIMKYSGVMHLVSRVTGRLIQGMSALEALAACFPAGTLSGAPKIRAMQLLSELEPEPRGFYGGAVIMASFAGDLDSCISIRSIHLDGQRATIQVGAGIVADSQPSKEYDEITHKSRGTRTALAAALQGASP